MFNHLGKPIRLLKLIAASAISTVLLVSFQNCSSGFSVSAQLNSSSSSNGGNGNGGNGGSGSDQMRQWPDTTSGIHIFHDQVNLANFSQAQIQFIATHYAGVQKISANDAATIRKINPNFLVLHYRLGLGLGYQLPSSNCTPNGHDIQILVGNNWVPEWPGDSIVQPQWLFGFNGSPRVYSCTNGWYIMNIANPSYETWWLGQVRSQLAANNDDGIFMDSFSIPNFFGSSNFSPNLPTVDTSFEDNWAMMMKNWLIFLKAHLPGVYLVPNVGSWITGRDHTDIVVPADGMMVEQFALPNESGTYAESDWQLEMNRILMAVARNQAIIGQTYVSSEKNRMFAVGSYLLIKGTRTYLSVNNTMGPEWYPEYDIPIGAATESAGGSIQDLFDATVGVYRRNFSNGFVLVNPSATSINVPLGGIYYLAQTTPDGVLTVNSSGQEAGTISYAMVNSVTLSDHSAAVLFNSHP